MMKRLLTVSTLASVLLMPAGVVLAADQGAARESAQTQQQVYGSQLMTEQERNEHREKMRAAKTPEERKQLQMENHERMKERAKARHMKMSEQPPAVRGGGMGSGGGR